MSGLRHKIFGQRNIGKQWGIFAQVASQLAIFVSMINLLLIAATAYNTTLSGWFIEKGIDIGFWHFVFIIVGLLGVAFILLYKFALPSFFEFWNDQFYRHDNPLVRDVEEIKKMLANNLLDIEKRVEKLEKK